MEQHPPLYVDLDGTLIRTDLLVESFIELSKAYPFLALQAPFWLLPRKVYIEHRITELAAMNPAGLPYHTEFLDYLKTEHVARRRLCLATASNVRYAETIAAHLGILKDLLASDAERNLYGMRQLEAIRQRSPEGFAYAGNDGVDEVIWAAAHSTFLVEAPGDVAARIAARRSVEAEFGAARAGLMPRIKGIRPHRWLKDLLVFLPLLPIATAVDANIARPASSGRDSFWRACGWWGCARGIG